MKSIVEGIYSHAKYTKGIQGPLGKFYGSMGGMFGGQGEQYGEEGASGIPKYDPSKTFDLESYFQVQNHFNIHDYFNLDAVSDQLSEFAVKKALGGK